MRNWIATTESGATYTADNRGIMYRGSEGGQYFHAPNLRSGEGLIAGDTLGSWVKRSQRVEEPVIGQRMYIGTINTWRLSTPIVSIEFTED